jgi:hypothetical protein
VADFVTFDEIGNLTAGLSYWKTGRNQLYSVNPPLPKLLASFPVLLANPNMTSIRSEHYPGERPEWAVGERFANDNATRYHSFLIRARSVGLLWTLLGALAVYKWAKTIWGEAGGLFSLAIWCFEPNIIAHAHLLNVDLPATTAGVWAAFLFQRHLKACSWSTAYAAGLVLGIAQLCKFTLLIFYPIWCILWLYTVLHRHWSGDHNPSFMRCLGQLWLSFAVSLLVINIGYGFAGTGKKLKEFHFVSKALAGPQDASSQGAGLNYGNRFEKTLFGELRLPLPEDMVRGIDVQRRGLERNGKRVNKYLRGVWSRSGWWYYYVYAIGVKVPLGLWGLLLFSMGGLARPRVSKPISRTDALAILVPGLVLCVFVSAHPHMQPHLRYILPAFPFAMIYVGQSGCAIAGGPCVRRLIAGGLLFWAAGSYARIHPHSLAYFNEAAGGPDRGHFHLEGSNIDWGQDLYRLKRWVTEHPEAKPLHLAYFNHIDPHIIGIDFKVPPLGVVEKAPADQQVGLLLGPHPGYFALSARFIYGSEVFAPTGTGSYLSAPFGSLAYFRAFQPVAKAGYSIYIFHITLDEANRVRRRYGLPTLPANFKAISMQMARHQEPLTP